jgi:hypothetical protein
MYVHVHIIIGDLSITEGRRVENNTRNQHLHDGGEVWEDIEPAEDEDDGLLHDMGDLGVPPTPPSPKRSDRNQGHQALTRPESLEPY